MTKIKMNRDFDKNRSDKYQYNILELSTAPEILTEVSDTKGLAGHINVNNFKEEMFELKDRLKKARWRLIEEELTFRQKEVIKLLSDGYTQMEVAGILGVNQSSVTKSVHGNTDYRNGRRVYGGAKKKLKKIAAQDPEIQEILKRMAEINNEISNY